MNALKFFRKTNLVFVIALSFFAFSCSQYEIQGNEFDTAGMELAKTQMDSNYQNTINGKRGLDVVALNKELMAQLQDQHGTKFEFPEIIYTLNNKTVEENHELAITSGFLVEEDLEKLDKFVLEIEHYGFETALDNFKEVISSEEMTRDKFAKWNMMVQGMELAKDYNPELFREAGCDWIDCTIATIAFIAAFIGLVTLEVGTAGLATAAVVVGFVAASAAWVRACQDCFGD